MKIAKLMFITLVFTFSLPSLANEEFSSNKVVTMTGPTAIDVFTEMFIVRPLSATVVVAGAGFFVGTLPLTGLMTAIRPHNAFNKVMDFTVVAPFKYLIQRPIGDWDYEPQKTWDK